MKIIIVLAVLMFPIAGMCANLQCDPQAEVDHYKITGDPFWTSPVVAQANGSLKSDVATIAVGPHTIQVAACKTDAVWGELCSSTVPFTFTRPAAPLSPSSLSIAP